MDPLLGGGGGGREHCRMRPKAIKGSVGGVTIRAKSMVGGEEIERTREAGECRTR